MVKTNLKILKHENKTGQSGVDYTRFLCEFENNGQKWMSAFESDLIEELRQVEGKDYLSVEVSEVKKEGKPSFFNIREIYGKATESSSPEEINFEVNKAPGEYPRKSNGRKEFDKDPVGLAVEVFNATFNTDMSPDMIMKEAVLLVKQAQKAFE